MKKRGKRGKYKIEPPKICPRCGQPSNGGLCGLFYKKLEGAIK